LAALVALRALGDFGALVCLTVLIFDDLADLDIFLDLHDLDLAFLDFLVFSVFENFPFDDLRCRLIDSLQKGGEVRTLRGSSCCSGTGGKVGVGEMLGLGAWSSPLGSGLS